MPKPKSFVPMSEFLVRPGTPVLKNRNPRLCSPDPKTPMYELEINDKLINESMAIFGRKQLLEATETAFALHLNYSFCVVLIEFVF